jgi:Ca2+-binding RTX toxin-like protein
MAGRGNDRLTAGTGAAVLSGGGGDDVLTSRSARGRDVLIGGRGADHLSGGGLDSLLIGAATAYDAAPAALRAVLAAWTQHKIYPWRVGELLAGIRPIAGGPTVRFDRTTIADDAAADVLTGNAGLDWFLFNHGDQLTDRTVGEVESLLA